MAGYRRPALPSAGRHALSGARCGADDLLGPGPLAAEDTRSFSVYRWIKDELIRLGVPARDIHIAWKGESEPLVQTGDGVKEPQNRRVEIVFD